MNDGKPRPLANGSGRILYPVSCGFSKGAAEGRSARPRRPSGAFRSRPSSIRRENRSAEEKGGSQKLRREAPKRQLPFPFFSPEHRSFHPGKGKAA
ncbi:MAG: hypothetical protein C6P37_06880 [Caldibacillus debilis]|uniref:Uncharacterized protein n=1 Tax=Caldibacillus debilis TaxID=301148 RepID=A0A3E0K513_9BACI|nr:MAG: hypothetical protein C6P37_06880 [Caldibacillus debilis]